MCEFLYLVWSKIQSTYNIRTFWLVLNSKVFPCPVSWPCVLGIWLIDILIVNFCIFCNALVSGVPSHFTSFSCCCCWFRFAFVCYCLFATGKGGGPTYSRPNIRGSSPSWQCHCGSQWPAAEPFGPCAPAPSCAQALLSLCSFSLSAWSCAPPHPSASK